MKTLVITSCCKEKLGHAAPAKDLYQGKLFKLVRKYAEENGFDWRILSAKYGLVNPEDEIEPYDLQIKGMAQIGPLQDMVLPALARLWGTYARVVVIMGDMYRKIINPALKRQAAWARADLPRVEVVTDPRGIGGILQQVKGMLASPATRSKTFQFKCPYCGAITEKRGKWEDFVGDNVVCKACGEYWDSETYVLPPEPRKATVQKTLFGG